jgi:hypothetical protein
MNALSLARWQFAITTVYHFIFVPITIGSGFLVAGFQTAWYRTNKDKYLRATKFFGKLFLINFAIGVVTGIVQEFQFGMNWSSYSRFVGDIFGAPLAMEGLLYIPWSLDLRLGSSSKEGAPCIDLDGIAGHSVICIFHLGSECIHATSSRIHDECRTWSC